MKKLLFTMITLLMVSGCSDSTVENIEADYFDISYGQSLYEGFGKVDQETVQSLVEAYKGIEYIGETSQQLNYDKAITIKFIRDDQISGTLVMDDKGIFHLNDPAQNYQIEPGNEIYEQAKTIFNDLDRQS